MKAWTDYPFEKLGDAPGEIAPVREVEVLSYDGNKYVRILVHGVEAVIKAGYLYRAEGRIGEVPSFTSKDLQEKFRNISSD